MITHRLLDGQAGARTPPCSPTLSARSLPWRVDIPGPVGHHRAVLGESERRVRSSRTTSSPVPLPGRDPRQAARRARAPRPPLQPRSSKLLLSYKGRKQIRFVQSSAKVADATRSSSSTATDTARCWGTTITPALWLRLDERGEVARHRLAVVCDQDAPVPGSQREDLGVAEALQRATAAERKSSPGLRRRSAATTIWLRSASAWKRTIATRRAVSGVRPQASDRTSGQTPGPQRAAIQTRPAARGGTYPRSPCGPGRT